MEERLAKVEGILEQMDKRLNHMEAEMSELRAVITELKKSIDTNFRWTVGLIIGIWVTVIVVILLK